MPKAKNRIGEIKYNNFGSKMKIIAYRSAKDIDVYFEEYDWTFYKSKYSSFEKGEIKCPYEPRNYNQGFIGEGKYTSRINGRKTKCYQTWQNILIRCYDEKYQSNKPTYKDCKICKEWLNFQNFAKWYEENYYECNGEQMHLDKDILNKGNKIYSPESCVFVPERINSLFTKNQAIRGEYPIGVLWHKRDEIFESWVDKIIDGKKKQVYLGRYNTSEEAFNVYKQVKEDYIKQVADEYKPYIPKELYDAMYRYEVEIND